MNDSTMEGYLTELIEARKELAAMVNDGSDAKIIKGLCKAIKRRDDD